MSRPVKRSFSLKGHRTSISIEAPFWDALREAATCKGDSLAALVSQIDESRVGDTGLSSAVRVWVLEYTRAQIPNQADKIPKDVADAKRSKDAEHSKDAEVSEDATDAEN